MADYYRQLTDFIAGSVQDNEELPVMVVIEPQVQEIEAQVINKNDIINEITEYLRSHCLQGNFSEQYCTGYYNGIFKAIECIENFLEKDNNE